MTRGESLLKGERVKKNEQQPETRNKQRETVPGLSA
jgi:hypothetical protein